jgi:hypothetical protein
MVYGRYNELVFMGIISWFVNQLITEGAPSCMIGDWLIVLGLRHLSVSWSWTQWFSESIQSCDSGFSMVKLFIFKDIQVYPERIFSVSTMFSETLHTLTYMIHMEVSWSFLKCEVPHFIIHGWMGFSTRNQRTWGSPMAIIVYGSPDNWPG